jgi:hypothetical protein
MPGIILATWHVLSYLISPIALEDEHYQWKNW